MCRQLLEWLLVAGMVGRGGGWLTCQVSAWLGWQKGCGFRMRLLPCRGLRLTVFVFGAKFHAQLKRLFNENKCA